MGKTKNILRGKFPEKSLTLDQQVAIVNKAGSRLFEDFSTGGDQDDIDAKVNNLALWLGGLHPDIQVYAYQLLLNYHQIEFNADDKTEARMFRLEERIRIGEAPGIKEDTYERINHYPWPVEYLDGTTFEDRLEALADELREDDASKIVTADMILTGTAPREELEVDQAFGLISKCLDGLETGTQRLSAVYHERANNYLGWLMSQEPEMAIVGIRIALTVYRVPMDPMKIPNFKDLALRYADLLR